MKKFKLVACAAAVAAMFGNAFAVDLDETGDAIGTLKYASEIDVPATGTALVVGGDVEVKLGATLPAGVGAFIRIDLPAGVTLGGDPFVAPTATVAGASAVGIAQGGAAGDNYVIFSVTPTTALNKDAAVAVTLGSVVVKDKGAVSVSYKLFETLTGAANNTLPLKTKSANLLTFAPALSWGTSVPAATAIVAEAYTEFKPQPGVATVSKATVIKVAPTLAADVLDKDGGAIALTDLINATMNVTVTGDFTAAATNGVTFGGAHAGATLATDKQSVVFANVAVPVAGTATAIEYEVTGDKAIASSSYSAVIDITPKNGYTVSDASTAGSIVRDGLILKSAFGETPVGSFSGTVNLTNTSNAAAPFTTSCLTGTGRVAGKAGSVPANSAARFGIGSSSGLGCPTATRGLELIFTVAPGNVIGSVVRQDATTGQASFDSMQQAQ
ncbi:hypothetical protein LOC51_26640 [Rubrivivax sp. JA1024]|nr:hypothetical protein [Rubrivivax sp. JA1024]